MTSKPAHKADPHLVVAMVTPFTAEGTIDHTSLGRLVGYLRENGVDEYFVVGSTGEAPLLAEADRLQVIEGVRQAAPKSRVYAGISGTGHRHAILNARDAKRAGADVGVLMAPYFIALDQEQLIDFCTAVADESPIPIALYHHLRMPTPFLVPTVARLAEHPNIIALKDTNGSEHDRCADIRAATAGRDFLFYQGVEKLVLSTLTAGGDGCVVAQACIAPRLFRALFDAHQSGQAAEAQQLQAQIAALWTIFSKREVKQSFAHFLRTLKLPLQQKGILATTAVSLPQVRIEPSFDRMVAEFMGQHLDRSAVSKS